MIEKTFSKITRKFNLVSSRTEERKPYTNRELSWIQFNERVLEEAKDETVPLCERLFFLSIFQSNLDEFFMVRVGSLQDQLLLEKELRENKTNMTAKEQIEKILEETRKICIEKDKAYIDIMKEFSKQGIEILKYDQVAESEKDFLELYFKDEILPLLSPMVVGRKQPFPFIRNKEIYAVVLLETIRGKEKIGIVSCAGQNRKRLVAIPSMKGYFILAEELILHFVPSIFDQYNIKGKSLIKVTRNADIDSSMQEDEELNYREMMEEVIKLRKKLSPVRLELSRKLDFSGVQEICSNLALEKNQVHFSDIPLDLGFVSEIRDILRDKSDLFFKRHIPAWPEDINKGERVTEQLKERDILLFFPYESMKPFLELLSEAADDPEVEVAAPIYDENIKKKIRGVFDTLWKDTSKVRELSSEGMYKKRHVFKNKFNAQEYYLNKFGKEGK